MKFSGKVIMRETGIVKNGKQVFMLFGVVGIQDDKGFVKSEHQYTLTQFGIQDSVDLSKITHGNTPDGLLCEPIWQV